MQKTQYSCLTRISHCNMKLSFLLRQWTMTGDNRYTASHSLYDSWQHRRQDDGRTQFTTVSLYCASAAVVQRQVKQKGILIFANIFCIWNPNIALVAGRGKICTWQQNLWCQLPKTVHSNYGSILLSFLDMTIGQEGMDNRRMTATCGGP